MSWLLGLFGDYGAPFNVHAGQVRQASIVAAFTLFKATFTSWKLLLEAFIDNYRWMDREGIYKCRSSRKRLFGDQLSGLQHLGTR